MMKKRILAVALIGSMLFGGAIAAAGTSIWGSFKGNDIVRVQYGGQTIKSPDVPAISYNGRTMIPLTMLGNLQIAYNWDGKTKTVDLMNTKENGISNDFVTKSEFRELNAVMQEHRAFITYIDQSDLVSNCISLLDTAKTQAEIKTSMEQVNRINISALDDWNYILNNIGSSDYRSFNQIRGYINSAKIYLQNGDTQSAHSQLLLAKSSMNILYNQLNNEFDQTFGPKNIKYFNTK